MNNALTDRFGRRIDYVRLSVTDHCNLRCFYCLPPGRSVTEPERWLSFEEIERAIRAFARLGVRRVRLTGGEPLTRRGLPDLAMRLARIPGIEDLSLSTNAVGLDRLAGPLRAAGIARLNVSLDSLRPDRFHRITGGGRLDKALAGLLAAKQAGFAPIKINMLALKGINDDEFEDMAHFCLAHGFTLRLIEVMPMGAPGRAAGAHYLDLQEAKQRLERRFELIPCVVPGGGPARYFEVKGTALRIGLITPISQHFCATCNRVRLAADGTLYLCLGQEHSVPLRPLLRQGATDTALRDALRQALALKPERHTFREHSHRVVRLMAATGG